MVTSHIVGVGSSLCHGPSARRALWPVRWRAGYLVGTVLQDFHARVFGIAFGPIDTIFAVAGLLGIFAALYAARNLRGVRLAGEDAPAP
jgi:hypothetical protein